MHANAKIAVGFSTLILLLVGCTAAESSKDSGSSSQTDDSLQALRPRPTPKPSPSPSPTATPLPTVKPSPSPTVTPTPSPSPTVTPSPTASPTPTPTVSPSPSLTITEIVNSQQATSHEAKIPDIRYEWQKKPEIIMQSPAAADIPSWFPYSKPAWCTLLNSWMQVFEAEGNTATNTRVQYRNLKVYVLSESTRTWKLLVNDVAPYTDTWKYPFDFAADGGTRAESTGGVSFKAKYPQFAHGYGKQNTITPQDIRAVFVMMETRLILDKSTGPDDRASARYLVNVGADYWPNAQAVNTSWSYAPGVGQGRFILATPEWRKATMIVPNGRYGSSMQEMIANPPPLN